MKTKKLQHDEASEMGPQRSGTLITYIVPRSWNILALPQSRPVSRVGVVPALLWLRSPSVPPPYPKAGQFCINTCSTEEQ